MIQGSAVCTCSVVNAGTTASVPITSSPLIRGYRVRNLDAAIKIYVGFDANLTTANGFLIGPGESYDWPTSASLHLIADSGTPEVNIGVFIG